jgi:hypothetical protein
MTTRHKKQDISTSNHKDSPPRVRPKIHKDSEGKLQMVCATDTALRDLVGVKTHEAALGLFNSAVHALGDKGQVYLPLMTATFAEIEPRDAIEAMLAAQMTATHVMMTGLAHKVMDAPNQSLREAYERSVTRLSRTYLAQIDALKKYRTESQQTVRVERVTVHEGGQAIVGDVNHGGSRDDEVTP